jgi:1,4-alpha-glucan branching enzyme
MHDTLDYTGRDPIYRGYHHNQMTFSLMYAFSENFVLPLSHDEVVHGKGSLWQRMPGDAWNKAANLRALLAYMWAHPGKQLLFQGGEFGQEREWSEQRSLDWHLLDDPLHGGIKRLVGDMNRAYREHSALWTRDATPEGFSWIDANDSSGNVLSFLRHGVDADGRPTVLACVANFSGSPKPDYRVGLPFAGRWREVLNTDATNYGGSGWGNYGGVDAEQHVWHGRPASAVLQLPPAGVLWLAPEPFEGAVRRSGAGSGVTASPAPTDAATTGPIARTAPADAAAQDAVTFAPTATPSATAPADTSPSPSSEAPTPPTGIPITPPPASSEDASTASPPSDPLEDAPPGPAASALSTPGTSTSSSFEAPAGAPTTSAAGTANDYAEAPDLPSSADTTHAGSAFGEPQDDAPTPTTSGSAPQGSTHPPATDLESGADPASDTTSTATPADEPTVSIPAGWGGEPKDLPWEATDEATVRVPASEDTVRDAAPAQPVDEATDTDGDASDDTDEGPTGSARRSSTAQ